MLATLLAGCTRTVLPSSDVPSSVVEVASPDDLAAQARPEPEARVAPTTDCSDQSPVPVEADDAVAGAASAPITMVQFQDYQCPFCARVQPTLAALAEEYGDMLRLVHKHNPLPFHEQALPAAVAAQAVLAEAGPRAFFEYSDLLFQNQRSLSEAELVRLAEHVGIPRDRMKQLLEDERFTRQVTQDQRLAQEVGAVGTPSFFINGILLQGAQPIERFRELIDQELPAAQRAATTEGCLEAGYVARSRENFEPPEPRPQRTAPAPVPPEGGTWKVPIAGSPVDGPGNALVTIVEFSDYQCPFCARVQPTLQKLKQKYAGRVRIVFKHNPLPFHRRAEPAAQLAAFARKQGGDALFFKATELLYENQKHLDDAGLRAVARKLGLDPDAALAAVKTHRYKSTIEQDQSLARGLRAVGTPQFFINGYRLRGAQPIEKFTSVIDERLSAARALLKSGTPPARIYAELMKDAQGPPPPERKTVTPPSTSAPFKGSKNAPIVIQLFSDFQCPFCARVRPTLEQLMQAHPGQIKLVWRHLPLDFHRHAMPAAEAALEAQAQQGNAGFWKMEALLYQNQHQLSQVDLERYAQRLGLDLDRFRRALADGRHRRAIGADKTAASRAGIAGTPAVVINGYFLSGAQPLPRFEEIVDYALKHPNNP